MVGVSCTISGTWKHALIDAKMTAAAPFAHHAALDLGRLGDPQTWRNFAPHFHVADPAFLAGAKMFALGAEHSAKAGAQITAEGYFQIYGLNWGLDIPRMVDLVRGLSRAGVSPAFAFLYDEFWMPFRKLGPILQSFLGPNAIIPDFWVWNVEPTPAQSGWAPHRDRGAVSLMSDGSAKSLTVWLPLTPATPHSSCMYVVPVGADPTYGTADEDRHAFAYQSIRALPATPGDCIFWNQAMLHWGSTASNLATESRVSIALQFQRQDQAPMREPLIDPAGVIPFEARLRFIASQVLGYRNLYPVPPAIEKFAMGLVGHLVR